MTNTQEQYVPGVMYYAEDLVGLMNEILVVLVKYFGCVRQRSNIFNSIKNTPFFTQMVQLPLSCYVVNKTIPNSYDSI